MKNNKVFEYDFKGKWVKDWEDMTAFDSYYHLSVESNTASLFSETYKHFQYHITPNNTVAFIRKPGRDFIKSMMHNINSKKVYLKEKAEFMKSVLQNSVPYIEGDIEIIDDYVNILTPMLIKDKYGLMRVMPEVLRDGLSIGSFQSVNRLEYVFNEIKDKNPEFANYILSVDDYNNKYYYLTTIYGKIKAPHYYLLRQKSPTIGRALDKTEFWVNRLKTIRKDFDNIDYSKSLYVNAHTKMKFRCKIHDYEYEQAPSYHEKGVQGCIHCMLGTIKYSKQNFRNHESFFKTHRSYLYVIKLTSENEQFYKVGITATHRLKYRMKQISSTYESEIVYLEEGFTEEKYDLEQKFLSEFKDYKYTPRKYFGGYSECLTVNPVDYYYESYYENLEYEQ